MRMTKSPTGDYWILGLKPSSKPEPKASLTYVQLGEIMLKKAGAEACQKGYGTIDPEWVGRYALDFKDIGPDGTLN